MVAFFAWGSVPNSFVVSNGDLTHYENMPENYEARFSSGEWNAKTVAALATGPGDIHWASFHNGNWAAHTPVTMHPYLEKELLVYGPNSTTSLGRGTLKFVSFPPNGKGWFARYSNNVCLWGPSEAEMTPTFRALVANLEAGHPRKDECIDFVSFGAHDTLAVRYENGKSFFYVADDPSEAAKVSQQLLGDINGRLEDGWTFGNRTTLCGWDTNRWFIEWKKGNQAEFCYSMGVGEKEDLEKVSEVLNAPSGAGNVNNNLAGLVSAAGNGGQCPVWLSLRRPTRELLSREQKEGCRGVLGEELKLSTRSQTRKPAILN